MLSSSIALLTALTRLEISNPTTALLAACAPRLPALCLQHVTLDTRDEGYCGTWNREPIVSEFACNVLHLNQLTNLQIRAFNLSCADVAALSLVLHLNTALVAINLALLGTTRQLAFQESREEFTKSERGVLSELCAALRALPLRNMTLELDFWMPETEDLLFQPVDSGGRSVLRFKAAGTPDAKRLGAIVLWSVDIESRQITHVVHVEMSQEYLVDEIQGYAQGVNPFHGTCAHIENKFIAIAKFDQKTRRCLFQTGHWHT